LKNTGANAWALTSVDAGALVLNQNNVIPATAVLNVGSVLYSGTLNLSGKSETVNGLKSNGGSANKILSSGSSAGTFTIDSATDQAFAGGFGLNGLSPNPAVALVKNGTSKQTLNLTGNTWTGGITINGSELAQVTELRVTICW
jgi:hypothetical protein